MQKYTLLWTKEKLIGKWLSLIGNSYWNSAQIGRIYSKSLLRVPHITLLNSIGNINISTLPN